MTLNYKTLRGSSIVQRNLNILTAKLKGDTLKGLIEIQSKIHNDMETKSPRVPVDLHNLSHSYFCVTSNGKVISGKAPSFHDGRGTAQRLTADHSALLVSSIAEAVSTSKIEGPNIIFGFSAHYAAIVHYSRDMAFKRPGAGPLFFDTHIKANKDFMLKTLAKYAKVKK